MEQQWFSLTLLSSYYMFRNAVNNKTKFP